MRESPMLFSAPMVRATRADLKTKTRRVIKPQPTAQLLNIDGTDEWAPPDPRDPDAPDWSRAIRCPYGKTGDRLWGRETFVIESNHYTASVDEYPPSFTDGRPTRWQHDDEHGRWWEQCHYRATDEEPALHYNDLEDPHCRWRPSIFMPRWASRLLLEVVSVRVERVQDISEADAIAEGVQATPAGDGYPFAMPARMNFVDLWDDINAKRGYGWAENPFVWVVEFRRIV